MNVTVIVAIKLILVYLEALLSFPGSCPARWLGLLKRHDEHAGVANDSMASAAPFHIPLIVSLSIRLGHHDSYFFIVSPKCSLQAADSAFATLVSILTRS